MASCDLVLAMGPILLFWRCNQRGMRDVPASRLAAGALARSGVPVAAGDVLFAVGTGDAARVGTGGPLKLQPVAKFEAVDHVHDFELKPAGLVRVAVPQRDHAAFLLGVEQDQGAIARNAAAMPDDAVAGIVVAAPAVAVVGLTEPLEEFAEPPALTRRLH